MKNIVLMLMLSCLVFGCAAKTADAYGYAVGAYGAHTQYGLATLQLS